MPGWPWRIISGSYPDNSLIGASTIPGGYLLPRLLGQFKVIHPETSVTIDIFDSRKVVEGVIGGSVQLGVTGAKISNDQLVYQLFATDELVLAAPPDHPLVRQKIIQVKALQGVKMIVREDGSGTRLISEARLRELGFEIEPEQVAAVFGQFPGRALCVARRGRLFRSSPGWPWRRISNAVRCALSKLRVSPCTRGFLLRCPQGEELEPAGADFPGVYPRGGGGTRGRIFRKIFPFFRLNSFGDPPSSPCRPTACYLKHLKSMYYTKCMICASS